MQVSNQQLVIFSLMLLLAGNTISNNTLHRICIFKQLEHEETMQYAKRNTSSLAEPDVQKLF